MLFRYVDNEPFDEVHCRDTFGYCLMILMSCVMKGNKIAVIVIDTGCSNDRSAQISAYIFDGNIRRTLIRFGSDIKSIWIFLIKLVFESFKGMVKMKRKLFEKDFTKSQPKECEIKMFDVTPREMITSSTFRDESMNMRIPFEVTTEGMEYTDETRSKIF